jgi:NAD(P)-dependent dehydrogenase (short-subunit alcohol dehydrogenase family)
MSDSLRAPLRGIEIVLAGGTGGLGSETARLLAGEGARVIASYKSDRARAERVGAGIEVLQADLSSSADRARLLDAAPSLYGLVVFSGKPARSEELLEESMEANFLGPIRLAREAAARMKQSGTHGAIVLISTMQTSAVFTNSTPYSAPKAALVHAARILAKECRGPVDIRVNVVSPGVNDAGMAQASIASGKYAPYLENGAIPRYGRAADVARAVRFFLEPDNYVTGQVLTVDGGLTM